MDCEIKHTFFGGEVQEFVGVHKDTSLSRMYDFVRWPTGPHAHQFVHVVSMN